MTKKTILVVDDEEHIRLLYKEEFEEEGYHVLLAGNGDEALVQVEKGKPDIVTLDIKMPDTDGITLARKIKEEIRDALGLQFPMQGREGFIRKSATEAVSLIQEGNYPMKFKMQIMEIGALKLHR